MERSWRIKINNNNYYFFYLQKRVKLILITYPIYKGKMNPYKYNLYENIRLELKKKNRLEHFFFLFPKLLEYHQVVLL